MHSYQVSQRHITLGRPVTVLTSDRSRNLPEQKRRLTTSQSGVSQLGRAIVITNFAPDIFQKVVRSDFDVLHVQSYHTLVSPIAMVAALLAKKPHVVSFHGEWTFPKCA